MKIPEKAKALKLRKLGYSFAEISTGLGISKSTASLWTRNLVLGKEARGRIEKKALSSRLRGNATSHKKKLERLSLAEATAARLLEETTVDKSSMLVALAIMYWCEGNKSDQHVGFTNSDPEMVRSFVNLLQEVFGVDKKKIKITVHLHDYHIEKEILGFWSEVTGIPIDQFGKSFKKKSNHTYKKPGYKGCVRVTYYDAHLARVILSFAKKLMNLYI